MSGYITYVKYSVATDKGQSWNGQEFNSPFALSKDGFDANFTSQAVVENVAEGATELTPVWTPVVKEAFEDAGVKYDVKVVHADGTFAFANLDAAGKVTGLVDGDKVAYKYDNVVIPQNDLPRIKAEMKSIPLVAKARRVAIYYSQIAAFQAKTDYGFDLGDQLAEQACGRLQYEIDTEIINRLDEVAGDADPDLTWDKQLPVGVSKMEHYQGFTEVIEVAKQKVYDATQRLTDYYRTTNKNRK